jgi:hypothetical protein
MNWPLYKNEYRCYRCKQEWFDVTDCCPDDDCIYCDARYVAPKRSTKLCEVKDKRIIIRL